MLHLWHTFKTMPGNALMSNALQTARTARTLLQYISATGAEGDNAGYLGSVAQDAYCHLVKRMITTSSQCPAA